MNTCPDCGKFIYEDAIHICETSACAPDLKAYRASAEAELERFATMVAAAEREACLKICETHTVDDVLVGVPIAQSCATAIRARSQA